ncbi:MAG: M28 family peptidase [Chitinophagaceae bacterium]|nr:MAG: M28 family peptidase [Chitinophagaceae bacterium]
MKAILTSFFALAVTTCSIAQSNFSADFQKISDNVQQHSKAYPTLKHASETIGHRLTGSVNGAKAEQYTFDLMKSYGLDVRFQPFEVESWSRKTVEVKIGNAVNALQPVKAVTLAHSPVEAKITGQLVDMGNGLEADYKAAPDAVKGKIALIYLGVLPGSPQGTSSLHRSEKTAIAIQYGAIGVVIINTVKNGVLLTGTASVTGKVIPIPAVCIGQEDGMALKERMKAAPQFTSISMTNFSGLIKARNVIATIKGKKYPKEKILVGGHLDSWDLAEGAQDDGTGDGSRVY